MNKKTAIIIGAGPAGLTAAYELLERTDIKPIIFEMTTDIGGISRTVNYKGNRIDIGGHRFFSKSDRIMQWWQNIFPLQGMPSKDDIILGRDIPLSEDANAPDPEKTDNVMLVRNRISRIFFMRKLFDYPISLNLKTITRLGFARTIMIAFSYIKATVCPIKPEKTLEDFLINRFGKRLYRTFFKDYTEKVWGVPCSQIKPEWGAQRIKGLSISRAIVHAVKSLFLKDTSLGQKQIETTLIKHFTYPKLGPGQMWEKVADIVKSKGGEVYLQHKVTGLKYQDSQIITAQVKNQATGEVKDFTSDYFFSTMPVKDLAVALGESVPSDVREVAESLVYRDFVTVGLLLKKLKINNKSNIKTINNIVPDNWIYIQEKDVKLGRLQIFNNWSPYMVKDQDTVWMGLEYFCTEGDWLWAKSDEQFTTFAIDELVKIGFIEKHDVIDSTVIRSPKTYPAYFGTYDRFDMFRNYIDKFENLFLIGRNGMHRYNNQDHSMLSAIIAVDNIAADVKTKDNIWAVNTEEEYHEKKITAVENLIDAYIQKTASDDFKYNPDIYWQDTGISYPHYPTVRHRKRFIINSIKKHCPKKRDAFIFDYGCGEGSLLKQISDKLNLTENQLGGSDISTVAIHDCKNQVNSPYLYNDAFPDLERPCDIIVCCELIEHTKDYLDILHWIKNNLAPGGTLILTTQTGKIHTSDRYTGHSQHFDISELNIILNQFGFSVTNSRMWGFPLFTMQKYLTDTLNFTKIRSNYLEGSLTFRKVLVFDIAYLLYFLHDFISFGPQIYIIAKNEPETKDNQNKQLK